VLGTQPLARWLTQWEGGWGQSFVAGFLSLLPTIPAMGLFGYLFNADPSIRRSFRPWKEDRDRPYESKRLVEEEINRRLLVYWSFAGLDDPLTTPLLALRAAVRQEQLLPSSPCSTNEEATRWVEHNLKFMGLASPHKIQELAAPEREALKRAMARDKG